VPKLVPAGSQARSTAQAPKGGSGSRRRPARRVANPHWRIALRHVPSTPSHRCRCGRATPSPADHRQGGPVVPRPRPEAARRHGQQAELRPALRRPDAVDGLSGRASRTSPACCRSTCWATACATRSTPGTNSPRGAGPPSSAGWCRPGRRPSCPMRYLSPFPRRGAGPRRGSEPARRRPGARLHRSARVRRARRETGPPHASIRTKAVGYGDAERSVRRRFGRLPSAPPTSAWWARCLLRAAHPSSKSIVAIPNAVCA
jgi:hypothetical protein